MTLKLLLIFAFLACCYSKIVPNDDALSLGRVINTYEPEKYPPFIVKIESRVKHKSKVIHCGGTAVSQTIILTAAHCFESILAAYWTTIMVGASYTRKVVVFGGHENRSLMSRLEVRGILVHPNFKRGQNSINNPDVAIIMVRSILPHMVPIALPSADTNDKPGAQVWIAGWGATRRQDSCRTNQNGPAVFQSCNPPEPMRCNSGSPPEDGRCPNFFQTLRRPGPSTVTVYDVTAGNETFKCYKNENKYGWCFTGSAVSLHSWGYCLPACNKPYLKESNVLNSLKTAIIEQPACKAYEGVALCLGTYLKSPTIGTYRKINGRFYFQSEIPPETLPFGGIQTSGHGDSGGPVWLYENGRAVLVGVITSNNPTGAIKDADMAIRVRGYLNWLGDATISLAKLVESQPRDS